MDLQKRLQLIKEVGEEIVTEQELKELLQKKKNPIAYDGFEPSGKIHIAQGVLRAINVNKLTKAGIKFKFWVADWFALMNDKMGGDLEKIKIPEGFSYSDIPGLSNEIKEKLTAVRPGSLGQASRISGVTPSAITILMVKLKAYRK